MRLKMVEVSEALMCGKSTRKCANGARKDASSSLIRHSKPRWIERTVSAVLRASSSRMVGNDVYGMGVKPKKGLSFSFPLTHTFPWSTFLGTKETRAWPMKRISVESRG